MAQMGYYTKPAQLYYIDGKISKVDKINDTHFPLAEGAGDVVYATDGTQGTLVGAPSWTTQDEYHYNIENGFRKYRQFNGTDQYVPIDDWKHRSRWSLHALTNCTTFSHFNEGGNTKRL